MSIAVTVSSVMATVAMSPTMSPNATFDSLEHSDPRSGQVLRDGQVLRGDAGPRHSYRRPDVDRPSPTRAPRAPGPQLTAIAGPIGATGHLLNDVDMYQIDRAQAMEPFLISVVSDTDLWMFISSTGALTAGRIDADHALFPYVTDDRLHRSVGTVGPVTLLARTVDGVRQLWRPFSQACPSHCARTIAKSTLGNSLVFAEQNERWGVTFRTTWAENCQVKARVKSGRKALRTGPNNN